MKNTDRILVLEKIDPKNKDIGLMDPRVLSGDNQLHAVMDHGTCMWTFKYDHGMIPPVLRQRYTSFKSLKDHADQYFRTRNIKIKEVID